MLIIITLLLNFVIDLQLFSPGSFRYLLINKRIDARLFARYYKRGYVPRIYFIKTSVLCFGNGHFVKFTAAAFL